MPLAKELKGAGSTTALVGSYETVAAALIDYAEIGCDLLSIRGWDVYNDMVDYGRYVLPLARQELAHRQATGSARSSTRDSTSGSGIRMTHHHHPDVQLPAPDLTDEGLRRVTDALTANAARYDRSGDFPWDSIQIVHEAGLLAYGISPEFGGAVAPTITDTVRIMQAIGHGDASVALLTSMTVAQHLANGGTHVWPGSCTARSSPTRPSGRC